MVQKEVKKKTTIYATAAILMAVLLISMVYSFGSISPNLPPIQTPSDQNPVLNPSIGPGSTVTPISNPPSALGMKTFSSLEQLKSYLGNASQAEYYRGATLGVQDSAPIPAPTAAGTYGVTADYSTTNIQVAGIDEADTVKTDGQYIYTFSNSERSNYYYGSYLQPSSSVYILSADPQDARVVSKISLDDSLIADWLIP